MNNHYNISCCWISDEEYDRGDLTIGMQEVEAETEEEAIEKIAQQIKLVRVLAIYTNSKIRI
jgi:hypothetical protein